MRTITLSLFLLVTLLSCEKPQSTVEDIDYDLLVEGYFGFSDKINATQWETSFRALNTEQLEVFFDKVSAEAIKREPEITDKIKFARKQLGQLNEMALQRYGTPMNALPTGQLSSIINDNWASNAKQDYYQQFPEQKASCPCYNYTCCMIKDGQAFWFANSTGRNRAADNEDCNDCDLELHYAGSKSKLEFVSGAGMAYYFTTDFQYRRTSSTTRVLIGYGAVNTVFLGSETVASLAYRVH